MSHEHVLQELLASLVRGKSLLLDLHQLIELHSPAGGSGSQRLVLHLVDFELLLLAHAGNHLGEVSRGIDSSHTVAIILGQHVLHQVVVALIGSDTALLHLGVQGRTEEGMHGGILQRRAPHLLGLLILTDSLKAAGAETLAVGLGHLLVITEHGFHEIV